MFIVRIEPMATTIRIDERVRDRLRAFCTGGLSYSEGITQLLDRVEMGEFFKEARRNTDDPDYPWIDERDFKWD